jgi:hypothetical protein
MSAKQTYPNLSYFFSCYLYQCALEEYGSLEGAVKEFVKSEQPEKVSTLISELNIAIEQKISRSLIVELGSYYAPALDEEVGSWLFRMVSALKV